MSVPSSRLSRFLIFTLLIASALLLTGFGPPRLTDSDRSPTRRLTPAQLPAWAEAQQVLDISAPALLLYDVDADRVLYTRAPDDARPMASLTKLMTALLVLEADDLDATVTIKAGDLADGVTMGLQVGEQRQEELGLSDEDLAFYDVIAQGAPRAFPPTTSGLPAWCMT